MAGINLSDAELSALFGDAAVEETLPSGTPSYTGLPAVAPPAAPPATAPAMPAPERADALFGGGQPFAGDEEQAAQPAAPPPGGDIDVLTRIADWRAKTFPQWKSREI